jgi:hypothetical protein
MMPNRRACAASAARMTEGVGLETLPLDLAGG